MPTRAVELAKRISAMVAMSMPELCMALCGSPEGIIALGGLCWANAPVAQSAAASAISGRALKFNVMRNTSCDLLHASGRYVVADHEVSL